MSLSSMQPPVFVMNLYYTGIGIARNLRNSGIEVYGLSSEKNAPGVKSRFFDGVYEVPNGRDEPEALCQSLLEIRRHHEQTPVIFPTRDFDVLFLHQYREQLSPFYRLPQPPGQSILRLLDKSELATVAHCHHIPVPRTAICSSSQDIEQQIPLLKFPLVIKPRFAYQWRRSGDWKKVGERKAILVTSADQLQDEYRRLAEVVEEILLQEYIEGTDSDITVCCCYINRNGELLGYFTGRKLRQNPPLFGTGCVVEAIDVPQILTPSIQLLRACGYTGLAEVEFKYQKKTNTFFLIEINPRHWDQHELGNLVGVNLTWAAYQDVICCSQRPQTPIYGKSATYKWIAEREALLLLLQKAYIEFTKLWESDDRTRVSKLSKVPHVVKKAVGELIDILSGQKVFAVADVHDPIPGILLFGRIFGELSRFLVARIWRRFFGGRGLTSQSQN